MKTYKIGTKMTLRVVSMQRENQLYQVEDDEHQLYTIKMFEFQKNEAMMPETLPCIVREIRNDKPYIGQDIEPWLRKFYLRHEVYDFVVRNDFSRSDACSYEVADDKGFFFQVSGRNLKLMVGQTVRCRVTKINGAKLSLEPVNSKSEEEETDSFLAPEVILDAIGAEASTRRYFTRFFLPAEALLQVRARSNEWIMTSFTFIQRHIAHLNTCPEDHYNELIESFRKACLFLLEDSAYVAELPVQERNFYQHTLADEVESLNFQLEAIRLIQQGQAQEYVGQLVAKMSTSHYLFSPERKLKVMMCLLTMLPELLNLTMDQVFAIILEGDPNLWRNEPFRTAFVAQLEMFKCLVHPHVDRTATVSGQQCKEQLHKLIEALAIQQLLFKEGDKVDILENQAMLCRYLTYEKSGKVEVLLRNGINTLCGIDTLRNLIKWPDTSNPVLLALKLSASAPKVNDVMMRFVGNRASLRLFGDGLELMPKGEGSVRKVQTVECFPGFTLSVSLRESLPKHKDATTVFKKHQLWSEVEHALFADASPQKSKTKQLQAMRLQPTMDAMVKIMVVDVCEDDPNTFYCKIVDDTYEGEGFLTINNIVLYGVTPQLSDFMDTEGNPYVLQAEVCGVNKQGVCNFKMREVIGEYVHQNVNYGDEVDALVLANNSDHYIALSEYGFTVKVMKQPDDPELMPGNFMCVQVQNSRSTGWVQGVMMHPISASFTNEDCFRTLLNSMNLSDEELSDQEKALLAADDNAAQQCEDYMSRDRVRELALVLDRFAVFATEYQQAFDLLAFARLICVLIDDAEMAEYYRTRMNLVELLDEFAINKEIDYDKIQSMSEQLRQFDSQSMRFQQLKQVSCLGDSTRNADLLEVINGTQEEEIVQLAQLVLSYNLLLGQSDGPEMMEVLRTLKSRIYGNINMPLPKEVHSKYGEEDLHTEFKTSLVYYPTDPRPNLAKQTEAIMVRVCGFLNAEGGTMYFGVNNFGLEVGMHCDLAYEEFAGSRDKFDLYFHQQVRNYMGVDADHYVQTEWFENEEGKILYKVMLKPSPYVVMIGDKVYRRQSSSTYRLDETAMRRFFVERNKALPEFLMTDVDPLGAAAPEPAPEPVVVEPEPVVVEPEPEPVNPVPACKVPVYMQEGALIATSQYRKNVVFNYEPDYVVPEVLLHFTDKGYILTEDTYWDPTLLSLAIYEDDAYVVLVYASGCVIKVPVKELLEKKPGINVERRRYKNDTLVFACPARSKDDALFMAIADGKNNLLYRVDSLDAVVEGHITENGELMSNTPCSQVVRCELVPESRKYILIEALDQKATKIGQPTKTKVGTPEGDAALQKLMERMWGEA